MNRQTKPDPYTSFKDDQSRLKALISRDIRFFAISVVLVAGHANFLALGVRWLARMLGLAA